MLMTSASRPPCQYYIEELTNCYTVASARRTTYTDVEWRDALKEKRPDMDIRLAPHLGDIDEIHYALVYDPPTGFLKQFPNLKATLSIASGVDHITKDTTYPDEVPVVRMSNNYQREMMAEYAVHAVLDHHRAMRAYASQQHHRVYQRVKTPYTAQTTVAVLGLGFIGAEVARKMSLMGFRVLGWSRSGKTSVPSVIASCGKDSLMDTVLPQCTYIVNVLPLTCETRGLLSAKFFAAMPKGSCVINLGRGGHIVEADLLSALESGHLYSIKCADMPGWLLNTPCSRDCFFETMGSLHPHLSYAVMRRSRAVLDVFATEPLPQQHPFWTHPNVVVTPHIAGDLVPSVCADNVIESMEQYEKIVG